MCLQTIRTGRNDMTLINEDSSQPKRVTTTTANSRRGQGDGGCCCQVFLDIHTVQLFIFNFHNLNNIPYVSYINTL